MPDESVLDTMKFAIGQSVPRAEDPEDDQHEHRRQRDQQVKDVHRQRPASVPALRALSTTVSELSAMPRPAAQGGSQPVTASGMPMAL